jgi:hypothetical protein
VAAVLEALILIPRPGHPGRLPADVPVADLEVEGVRLIPLTEPVRADCQRSKDGAGIVEGFYGLSNGVARRARELSREWVVLYVHLEFFGGEGSPGGHRVGPGPGRLRPVLHAHAAGAGRAALPGSQPAGYGDQSGAARTRPSR